MVLSVNEELRRAFDLVSLRREAETTRTSRQWHEIVTLQRRCREARTREIDLFATRYDTRVEVRRRQLIDKAGQRTVHHKPIWASDDRFDRQAILRQAQRDVRNAHTGRIQRIDEYERRKLREYLDRFRRENRLHGLVRDEFNRTSDRRSGRERRQVRQREH